MSSLPLALFTREIRIHPYLCRSSSRVPVCGRARALVLRSWYGEEPQGSAHGQTTYRCLPHSVVYPCDRSLVSSESVFRGDVLKLVVLRIPLRFWPSSSGNSHTPELFPSQERTNSTLAHLQTARFIHLLRACDPTLISFLDIPPRGIFVRCLPLYPGVVKRYRCARDTALVYLTTTDWQLSGQSLNFDFSCPSFVLRTPKYG